MDDDDSTSQDQIQNLQASSLFTPTATTTAPITSPHLTFSHPRPPTMPPPTQSSHALPPAGYSSEMRPPSSNRARIHFERAARGLPPLFSQQSSGPLHNSNTPPISPLSLFSPRTGFPGPLLPSLREGPSEVAKDGNASLAPLSPMNYTPVISSPMEVLPSPMFHVGENSHQVGDCTPRGLTPLFSPMDPPNQQTGHDSRDLNDLSSVGFSRNCRGLPSSPRLCEQRRGSSLNESSRIGTVGQYQFNPSVEMTGPHSRPPPFSQEVRGSPQDHVPNQSRLSSIDFPESPMFRPLDHLPLNLPGPTNTSQDIGHTSAQGMTGSVFQSMSQNPASSPTTSAISLSAVDTGQERHRGIYGNSFHLNGNVSSGLPSLQHRGNITSSNQTALSDPMDIAAKTQAVAQHGSSPPHMGILPHIIIDRPLIRSAELVQQKVVRSPRFTAFVDNLKESHRQKGDEAVGGTVRRRSDLIKVIVNIEEYGYPSSDREDIHTCLDTTPGLSRENVDYLKAVVMSQLETVKRGAREALYQFSVVLVDQLRYRVMTKGDILALQCSIVDRFVVARNCILEKYIQYVRSRRWIENMSTNQRRGCLSHQQNNILRMWLYRNFTDPYPDEEAKEMMMEETKLSMEQVNNWLINARSRFWRPSMDYFDRTALERKMGVLIRQRMVMTTEQKIKAASSKSGLPVSRGRTRRQAE